MGVSNNGVIPLAVPVVRMEEGTAASCASVIFTPFG